MLLTRKPPIRCQGTHLTDATCMYIHVLYVRLIVRNAGTDQIVDIMGHKKITKGTVLCRQGFPLVAIKLVTKEQKR